MATTKKRKTNAKKQTVRRPAIFKWFKLSLIWALLSRLAVKHRKHARRLGFLLVTISIICGAWLAYQVWQMGQIQSAQRIANSQFDNIKIESKSYNSEKFHGYAAYVVTENKPLNAVVSSAVDGFFIPCKAAGERNESSMPYECNANFTIDFATPAYLQLTYLFRENLATREQFAQTFLFDRKTGARLSMKDIFKPDQGYLSPLATAARAALKEHFKEKYDKNEALQKIINTVAEPREENFANFALSADEKIAVTYNELAAYSEPAEPVTVTLAVDSYYSMLNDRTVETFFPKVKEQKDAERKLAEEAKRKAEEADVARRAARQKVAANRSNIDCAAMKCVALTFDDGPHAVYTNQILDILRERQAVATFFVLGSKVAANAAILQRATGLNNEIGNHTWSHAQLTSLSDSGIQSEVRRTDLAIYNATGSYPKLLRPPYGASDGRVRSIAEMPIAMWSVDTQDWLNRSADITYQRAVGSTSPGSVILMHDIHGSSVSATARIIDELQRQGYVFVTMSELFGIGSNNILNFSGSVLSSR